VHSYPTAGKLTLHHADVYRLDHTRDVDELALDELAAFDGVVLIEWGDVVAGRFGDHLEVRLEHADLDTDTDTDDAETPDGDESLFADSGARLIELHASGPAWAGRWDRLSQTLGRFRC
jgi:tRNA threonylcarbamoyladenosine biosynthesis protein TsaE